MILFWIIVFIVSLAVMVKGADWLLSSAEKIGLVMGLSPFIVGVLIVGIGTSFPELIVSLAAMFKGVTEIITANAVGSNISNILLIIGAAAVVGRRLVVTKSLIDLDLPMLAVGTVLFLGVVWDKQITQIEGGLLVASYLIYLLYTVMHKDDTRTRETGKIMPTRQQRRKLITVLEDKEVRKKPILKIKDFVILVVGVIGLSLGAKYLIDSVIELSELFNIAPAIISITALAIGTSLPELIVSIKAALSGKSEVAIGNIFGSNAFNALVVVGLPGIFKNLVVDETTFSIGVPAMALATLLFIISGISRRIHVWDGAMYLIIYILFIGKLFNLF